MRKRRFHATGLMHRLILAAVLVPSLAAAQQEASQASYLQFRHCLASASRVPDHAAGQGATTPVQSPCPTQRARLAADIYQGLRAEGRPESMSRRIAADAVDALETRIRAQLAREAQAAP